MSEAPLLDYLLGDGPEPNEELLAEFTEMDLPEGLASRTLNAVAVERTRIKPVTSSAHGARRSP